MSAVAAHMIKLKLRSHDQPSWLLIQRARASPALWWSKKYIQKLSQKIAAMNQKR